MRHSGWPKAWRCRPGDGEAFDRHMRGLVATGRVLEARRLGRAALAREPGWAPGLMGAAWALAADPDATGAERAEAVRLAEGARRAMGDPARALDTLAAAYAAAGRRAEAVEAARAALAQAEALGDAALVRGIRARLTRYGGERPPAGPEAEGGGAPGNEGE